MSTDGFPADIDGDVLRRLKDHGFDFSRCHDIDFNVEFEVWPPSPEAIARLEQRYRTVTIDQEEKDVVVRVSDFVTYDLVVQTQATISNIMRPFGGTCEAWGVPGDGSN
jgi:hypothetical protein